MNSFKNRTKIGLLLLVMFSILSCSKSFLEIEPRGKLISRSFKDYDLLFNNLNVLNTDVNTNVPMGDEVIMLEPYAASADIRTQRLFRWEDVIYEPNENSRELAVLMLQLYTYNKIANEVLDVQDGTKADREALQAEARANRVWSNFMLVNYYSKPYLAATAGQDLGFPIVTTSDVTTSSFTRPSVQENYDFMLKELQESIPLIPKNPVVRARLSRAAAKGLLGKLYVFMGKYDLAITAFNDALSDLPTNFATELIDYNITTAPGGGWNSNPNTVISGMPAGWINTENLLVKQFSNGFTGSFNYILVGPRTLSLYNSDDKRLFFFSSFANGGTALLPGIKRRNGPSQGQFGLMLPDIYLLRAEAKARTNDIAGAIQDLEILRKKRMPANSATVSITQKDELIRFIIDERIREFAVLGYRWLDMRRLSTDPLFQNMTYKHQLYDESGEVKAEYTLRPERMVLRFPDRVMLENPGMPNNP